MDDYHTIVWTVLWNPVTSLEELMGPTGAMARGGSGVGEFLPKEADKSLLVAARLEPGQSLRAGP